MSLDGIVDLFQRHRDELGFINRARCREKDTYSIECNGVVVGAAICNHCVRKPQTTLYDIAVDEDYRRNGIATDLIEMIAQESPHDKIVAKCPVSLDAMEFYKNTGWVRVGTEDGKNVELSIWVYNIGDNHA